MHKHKEFQQKPPTQTPPSREPLTPLNSLCMGPLCPSKYRKNPCIKNFGGGVLGSLKFYALIVCVFICCLKMVVLIILVQQAFRQYRGHSLCFKGYFGRILSETGLGGVKTYRTLEGGGELAPKVVQIEGFL